MKTVGYIGSALSFLCALSSGANPSPRLEIQRTGDEITVAWTEHGILEASGSTSGPWKEVPNAGSPYKFKATSQVAFFRIKQLFHVLSVTRAGTGTGSVAADPAGIQCGTDCAEPYLQGTVVKLIAMPDPGSQFVGWTGDASGTEPCEVQMDAPRSVTANFVVASLGGLLNGGFEDGPGVGWTQEPGQLIYRADELGVPAYSGKYLAWIGYAQDNRHYAGLRQQVVLLDDVSISNTPW